MYDWSCLQIPLGRGLRCVETCQSICKAYWLAGVYIVQIFAGGISQQTIQPETRRRSDVVTTCLCTSQWRRRYLPNETPNDVSVERRQDASVVRLHDVSNKSQMKHPMTSQWNVAKTSQWYVFTMSQTSLKWNTQWRLNGTSSRRLTDMSWWLPMGT